MANRYPLDIVFCTGGLAFDGNTIKTKSLGGSESAALYMARALAARGNRVTQFTNIDEEVIDKIDGVRYAPISLWFGHSQDAPHDVHIIQRNPNAMAHKIASKLSILWCHDLAIRRTAETARAAKWRTDKTFLLSKFHADQYKQVIGYEDEEIYQTRNGFDFSMQPRVKLFDERDQNLFLYCARPERGLEHVLQTVFPVILAANPNARLAITTYDNAVPEMAPFYRHIQSLIDRFPKGSVIVPGALTKAKLYDMMSSAAAYLYPTPGPRGEEFAEISCIAAIEAQACGLPFIHTGVGALSETLPDNPLTKVDVQSMAEAALHLTSNPGLWHAVQRAQLEHVRQFDWDKIAEEWEESFHEWIAERNTDRTRLAAWFYKRSEIEGARIALEGEDNSLANVLKSEIARHYAFTLSEETLAEHYASMGESTYEDLSSRRDVFTLDAVKGNDEPRFQFMQKIIADEGIKTIFDAGCGHGWSSLFFANNLPVKVVGLDVDPGAIKWAQELKAQTNAAAEVAFTSDWAKAAYHCAKMFDGPAEAAVLSEVLEHVIDPAAFAERSESFVKPGGLMIITVPFGPWEYGGPNWVALGRTHIRELSQHCLQEMFGHKPDFRCGAVRTATHPVLGDPLGFYLVTYRADHTPIKQRNLQRLIELQRPTETLSVNIIAGPGSERTIRWTLESVQHIADEIVVGNTGMNDAAMQACIDFGAKVVVAPKPLEAGFSASRNAVLDHSCCDWILWIDTDERLMQPETVRQYLRKNQANGYALRQIHASSDEHVQSDTPVRLFRRKSGCRFFGVVHEHPETGINKGPGNVCIVGGYPAIWHVGYETNHTRAQRFVRNRPLVERDRRENPDRALGMYLEARDQILLMREHLARNNNQPNEKAIEHARKALDAVALFEASDIPLMGINTQQFKSDALRILGLGFDALVDIKLQRDGVGDPGTLPMRFADQADLEAFIARTIKDKMERLSGPYW